MQLLEALLDVFSRYGYYFLFLATALENIPVIGIFLPGEAIVVAAGFFAFRGEFSLPHVIIIACLGAITGTIASYIIGLRGGRVFLEMIAAKLNIDGHRLNDAEKYFHSHGAVTVFIGRYLTGVKAFIPALAGTHRMPFGRFFFFAVLGVVSWTVIAGLLGYFFGQNWPFLMKLIRTAGWLILTVVLLLFGLRWYLKRRG